MDELIQNEITSFVADTPLNLLPGRDINLFDEPLVGFASADDALFVEYKSVIGEFHQTPHEVMEGVFPGIRAASVISWILPISREIRVSNRSEELYPSREWALTRFFGEQLNAALRRHLVGWLESLNYNAVAPQLAPAWREFVDTPAGIASTWSERHAAYAAGLGTFSLNDALITPKGIAHRCGSVITDCQLAPSGRGYSDYRSNCLYYRNGGCGACIRRCPVGALTRDGHDKNSCRLHVYTTSVAAVAESYGVTATGCGLCQTGVPCESRIPYLSGGDR